MDRLVFVRGGSSVELLRAGSRIEFLRSGIPGAKGDKGDSGNGGGSVTPFVHSQNSPSPAWTVNHNFSRYPAAVSVLSIGGVEVEASVINISVNQLLVEFSSPQTGSVRVL